MSKNRRKLDWPGLDGWFVKILLRACSRWPCFWTWCSSALRFCFLDKEGQGKNGSWWSGACQGRGPLGLKSRVMKSLNVFRQKSCVLFCMEVEWLSREIARAQAGPASEKQLASPIQAGLLFCGAESVEYYCLHLPATQRPRQPCGLGAHPAQPMGSWLQNNKRAKANLLDAQDSPWLSWTRSILAAFWFAVSDRKEGQMQKSNKQKQILQFHLASLLRRCPGDYCNSPWCRKNREPVRGQNEEKKEHASVFLEKEIFHDFSHMRTLFVFMTPWKSNKKLGQISILDFKKMVLSPCLACIERKGSWRSRLRVFLFGDLLAFVFLLVLLAVVKAPATVNVLKSLVKTSFSYSVKGWN